MKKSSSTWSREEEKAFEKAIALHWGGEGEEEEESEERWEKMAEMMPVPQKSVEELRIHFEKLVDDVKAIEAGNVALPSYAGEESTSCSSKEWAGGERERKGNTSYSSGLGAKGASKAEHERRKGIPWSEEEHRLFLLGLDKFGKGDWRSISRNFVISRTPTQVASHAQKYFIRMNSINRERRRSSIHDITSINNGDPSSHQPPITGHQPNATASPNSKHRAPPPPHLTMYGTPLGHPVTAAVGTPVMLPPPARPPYVLPVAYPLAR